MKKRTIAFVLALLLCLTACQSDQEAIYSKYTEESSLPTSSPVQADASEPVESEAEESPKKELSGELTISDMRKIADYGTDAVVSAFQKEYPNVKITVDYSLPEGERLTTEAYTAYSQRLATQLMGGESADIITYWDGMVSAKNIAENGYALDLYEWMDNDADFHKEDYFANLFEALEYKDKLYQLPVLFNYTAVVLNSHITEELGYTFQPWDKIDYQTIISIYKEADEKGLLADGFTMEFEDLMNGGYLF
ncbi:extracellular solute-binding protein, partial [Acutalibacter muris]|uniref:extracellular solute-binding protein n=2 Tax=Acutalibacter TaxID=1918385 RepID=UPI00272E9945